MEAPISASQGPMRSLPGKLDLLLSGPKYGLRAQEKNKIRLLQGDLRGLIDNYLLEPSEVESPASTANSWMAEVRDLSYNIDDFIDELTLEGGGDASTNIAQKFPRVSISRFVEKLKRRQWVADEISEFRIRVKEAIRQHKVYLGNCKWRPGCGGLGERRLPPSPCSMASFHLVGMDSSIKQLCGWLANDGQPENKVASIVGIGGVGKTTLAEQVYRKLGGQFDCLAFVQTSRKPETKKLLASILCQVQQHQLPDTSSDVHTLVTKINAHLRYKTFLIVIDDLWTLSTWDIVNRALPKGDCCSRILTTTEVDVIARTCCADNSNYMPSKRKDESLKKEDMPPKKADKSKYMTLKRENNLMCMPSKKEDSSRYIIKMGALSEDESRELFLTTAFGQQAECHQRLQEVSNEIIKRSGGLPLTINILAGLFARQPTSSLEQWNYIKNSLSSSLTTNASLEGINQVLNLGYDDLPHGLKACMLYLSLYEEDCVIWKDDLMKQWIAEGFICAKEGDNWEEVAWSYFDELINRGMIQLADINCNGEILSCRVHHMVFNFIRNKAIEENFSIAIDHSQTAIRHADNVRRLALHFGHVGDATLPAQARMSLSKVRSVAFFGFHKCMPSVVEYRFLQVLRLKLWVDPDKMSGNPTGSDDRSGNIIELDGLSNNITGPDDMSYNLTEISELFLLKYFRLDARHKSVKLPTQMQRLKDLVAWEIYAEVSAVPSDIIDLPGLLYLSFPSEAHLPTGIGRMTSLRTLGLFDLSNNSTENLMSLGDLTNLQDLRLTCSTLQPDNLEKNLECLGSIIQKLSNLKSVTLVPVISCRANNQNDSGASSMSTSWLGFAIAPLPPSLLQTLELSRRCCIFSSLPKWIKELTKLRILKIALRKVSREDVVILKGLPSLTALSLFIWTVPVGSIIFDDDGFSVLKYFKFVCAAPCLAFLDGAMPNIRKLKQGFNANIMERYNFNAAGFECLINLSEISIKIGGAGANEETRRSAQSVLSEAISNHPRSPIINVKFVDWNFSGDNEKYIKAKKEKGQAGWYTSTAAMNIPYFLFKMVTKNFSEDRIIGKGTFGKVYKGELDDGELIAVKMLHPVQGLDDGLFKNKFCNNFFTDDHPNIIGLLGYCDEIHSEFVEHNGEKIFCKHIYRVLCFEYFPRGSLQKQLYEQSLAPNWSTRYNIIKGICEGLNFLHGCEPPIFHLNLKPANVLLDSSMVPKLADFGLSRHFSGSCTSVTQRTLGTDMYMPPEYRIGGIISSKNDVFSFGVVMMEIMEGYSLFQEMDNVTQFKQEVFAKCSRMIEPTMKYRPQLLLQVKTCIDIALHCVDSERKNRPTIATILATLNKTESHIPYKQLAFVPLSPEINLKNSLAEILKKMTAKLDNMTNSVANMEQIPDIREASSNVEEALISRRTGDRETSSYVEERLIIGRTEEKKEILSILSELSTNEMGILPIYGIGGIGKTTMAQLVFNDTQFQGYSRVWVYVSEKFDLNKIGNSIVSQLSNKISHVADMQMLHNHLAYLLVGKRVLIVLDDLWENDLHELYKLKAMLRLGQGSNVIIVTTRDEAIARNICNTAKCVPYKLGILTDDMCWTIIKQNSCFEDRHAKIHSARIGRDIAIRCGGVALAAQSLGYILRDMTFDQWESVRNNHIWNSSSSEDPLRNHQVLPSLWLCYSYMHAWLRSCFLYCAVFPKGYMISKYDLIHQWVALGITEPSKIFDAMQLCELYISKLLGMSFLQYPIAPSDEYSTFFTMHDLVHDLARAMDKINKNSNDVGNSYQYTLLTNPSKPLSCPGIIKALHLECNDKIELPDGIFSPAKNLLVLDISNCRNRKLPNSIGKLKQLRYLSAPYIPDQSIPMCINKLPKLNYLCLRGSCMTALPDSIGDMKGLMYLDLAYCEELSQLPVSFANLKQLVHLDLSYCHVPISESWGGFTKLQYLNLSGCQDDEQDFKVLLELFGKLTKLRYLSLAGCMSKMSEADIHSLLIGISTLCHLEHLDLCHSERLNSMPESIGNLRMLHTLQLSGCKIRKLPAWMAKMASLKIVNMTTLDECYSNLVMFAATNARKLKISQLEDVKSLEEAQSIKLIEKRRMDDLELEWTVGCHKRSVDDKDVLEKLVPPNTIRTLNITGYISLSFPTNWLIGIGQYLPNVSEITLKDIPGCNNLPPLGQLPNLQYVCLHHLESLEELYTTDFFGDLMFAKLDTLRIISCPKLRIKPCLPRALSTLSIDASDNILTSWGECVSQTGASYSSSQLTTLVVKGSMVPLYQWSLLQHVSALRRLVVRDCSDLASSSPEVIQRLSLESLELKVDGLTELPTWFVELVSLQRLTIIVPKLAKPNDNTTELTTGVQSLVLSGFGSMVSLPWGLGKLTSLKELKIVCF